MKKLSINQQSKIKQVLIIGDSISMGYTPFVQYFLKGKATVQRPDANCEATIHGLRQIEQWLGENKWDVIHFNWGLHDLVRKMDTTDPARLAGIAPQVSLPEYEKNLRTLVRRLKKTGAKLIWAATTPIPDICRFRIAGDDVKYNKTALRIMADEHIPVNDLHALMLPKLSEFQESQDVHFNEKGYEFLAKAVARSIEEQLNLGN